MEDKDEIKSSDEKRNLRNLEREAFKEKYKYVMHGKQTTLDSAW